MTKKLLITITALLIALNINAQKAKYIFLFIADGMGMGHVATTQLYNQTIKQSSQPLTMLQFPIASQMRTNPYGEPITDSAAAGTAIACGKKTRCGMIGEDHDSLPLTSIAKLLHTQGYGIAIGSTVAGDDATPAAFYAHAHNRAQSNTIAQQAATSKFEFLAAPTWREMNNPDSQWLQTMQRTGYNITRGYNQFATSKSDSQLQLLLSANPQGDQTGFTIDSISQTLTAAQITQAAISHLQKVSPDKFFIMIEGGNIDWAAHANDGGAVIKEIIAYQQAIQTALDFYADHSNETLIIVTADHDTGGMTFGRDDNQKQGNLALIDNQRTSKDRFADYCRSLIGTQITWQQMCQTLKQQLGMFDTFQPTETETARLKEIFDQTYTHRHTPTQQQSLYNSYSQFTIETFNILNRHTGIGFTSSNHTASFVPLYAIGCGSELLAHNIDNTQLSQIIISLTQPTADNR